MSVTVQCVPHDRLLGQIIASAKNLLCLCSPFVTAEGVEMVLRSSAQTRLITKATAANLGTKALDANALRRMLDAGAEVRSIPNLHAKIYLIDGRDGVVTSSNLTGSGLYQNVELGLYFSEEEGIYRSVSEVFERFWTRSIPVTVEGLERLTGASRAATFDRGVWTKRAPEASDEPLLPAPVIGFLEVSEVPVPVQSDAATRDTDIECDERSPAPDESGDLFVPLPKSGIGLIARLRSAYPPVVQAALNALALTSPRGFRTWLGHVPESDLRALAGPADSYPYKTRVVERIITDGGSATVVGVIRAMTDDLSNESQIVKYFPILNERLAADPREWAATIAPPLLDVAKDVANLISVSTAGAKNFARPNFDRVCALLTHTGLGTEFHAAVTALYSVVEAPQAPQQAIVPGFQTIRRTRESTGDSFRDWAFAHFPSIQAGGWDTQLSSLMALFKELGKISLRTGDHAAIQTVAVEVRRRLDATAADRRTILVAAADEWERQIDPSWLAHNRHQMAIARAELSPSGQQAVKATGRWVSLYGQGVKGGHAPAHKPMKDAIDWLTTYLSLRKTLSAWTEEAQAS